MDGNLASTYTLIHAFLIEHSHTKAAQAVKKAAKEVVILKDDIDIEGPQLDKIIAQWKLLVAKKTSSESTSESESDSSSSGSSSSSSSSSSPGSSPNRQTKKVKAKGVKKKVSSSSSSSSSSPSSSSASESNSSESESSESESSESESESDSNSSSSSDSDSDISPSAVQSKAKVSIPLAKSSSSECSSSNSDSGSESDDEAESSDSESSKQKQKLDKNIKPNTPKVERDSSRTLSSENNTSSGSEPESDDQNEDKEPLVSPKRESSASTDSTSEAGTPKAQIEDEIQVTKKRRTDIGGAAIVTATTLTVRQEETRAVSTGRIKDSNARPGRQVNERFRRVDPAKVESIMDNRYVAKVAPTNDYGQQAHEALIVTRGQGFRKEKNKKKKGSYRGGEITMESHSFKFA